MKLDKVHLFGASLGIYRAQNASIKKLLSAQGDLKLHKIMTSCITGGFLAQKFAEVNAHCPRVVSLILCNTFTDTSIFSYNDSAVMYVLIKSFWKNLNE